MKPRLILNKLPDETAKSVVLLSGARQTGKTTAVKKKYPSLRYINLDAVEDRDKLQSIRSDAWSKSVGRAVIDEAQKLPEVFEKIKYAYDEGGLDFSVLLGSSQILLLKKIRESLAGRVSLFDLYPLMLCELVANKQDELVSPLLSKIIQGSSLKKVLEDTPSVLFEDANLARDWEEYLLRIGGMPALLSLADERAREDWILNYEQTYLERDLSDLARVHDLQPFRVFQKLSALRSAQLINFSELARDAGVSADTAKRYIEYLKLSYQVVLLQPYHQNLTSALVKTPKLYWLDIGIWRSLANYRGNLTGQLFETYVVSECYKWIKTERERAELYFYRTRSGMEVDLLIETEHGLIGVEIKSRAKVDLRDASGLLALEKQSKRWLGGVVVYRGDHIQQLSDRVWAIPSSRLFSF